MIRRYCNGGGSNRYGPVGPRIFQGRTTTSRAPYQTPAYLYPFQSMLSFLFFFFFFFFLLFFFFFFSFFFFFFFFFSSRRRHTRSTRDWSSDVCSSDLGCALRR